MSMRRILIADGNVRAANDSIQSFGGLLSAERHEVEIKRIAPDTETTIVFPAYEDAALPRGTALQDYHGLVLGGSALHITNIEPAVTRQVDLLREALEQGVPILGTCWGLQVGAVAAGGSVRASPNGREVGIARKVSLNEFGQRHPLFDGKAPVFDSPCIHFDEVSSLPEGARVLASNGHSAIQAAEIPFGNSVIWGVQYHPEFDLPHLSMLYRRYADSLIKGGFFEDISTLEEYAQTLDSVASDAGRLDLQWQLGIDDDVLDPALRCLEIKNWLESLI